MITSERIEQLLKAQDELNKVYAGGDWSTKGYDFLGYAAVETAELLNHHGGMFHYRHQEPDWPQVEMELVDILHFLLSAALIDHVPVEDLEAACNGAVAVAGHHTVETAGKMLMHTASSTNTEGDDAYTNWLNFIRLVDSCGYTLNHIFNRYILKHTLNRFRIGHGSVTGGYKKVWGDGREDNEHLQALAPLAWSEDDQAYGVDTLYALLQRSYADATYMDPLESLSAYGFIETPARGVWEKFCATVDERESAISKVVCIEDAKAESSFFVSKVHSSVKGWKVRASLKERRPINR